MKLLSKIFPLFCLLACFAACEDIPMPYEPQTEDDDNDSTIYYSSASLYNGWTLVKIGDNQPWSQGSSYTQATGYQKWDGADTKSNRAAEGLLVSPAFHTKALKTGKVKISFDNCVGYANNDAAYADHIKLLISKGASTSSYNAEEWQELDWKATHESTDWTLTKDEVQLPDDYVNQENVRIAYWFVTGSADKSVTFELKNFVIEEGVASGEQQEDGDYIYMSANLNEGWHSWTDQAATHKSNDPWSLGSSYAQATGYQKWDGADTKSNREAEGYLISPAIKTTAASGKVKIGFDNCVGYANNDANFADHIRVYVSKTSDGSSVNSNEWVKLDWTASHVSTDWTLTTDEIQLPNEYVNQENVHFAFYFYTAASKSVTFELKNFFVAEGEAGSGTDTPPTPTEKSTKENPYTVAQALTGSGSQYVKGYIVGYIDGKALSTGATFAAATDVTTNLLMADKADEKDVSKCLPVQLPAGKFRDALNLSVSGILGKQLEIYGSLEQYFGAPGLKNPEWAKLDDKEVGETPGVNPTGSVWDFTKSQCNFTIENKTMPEALSYIWQQSAQYGMKASAYVNNTDYACEGWLISPETDLTGKTTMGISHAGKFFASADQMKKDITIWASQNGGTWKQLSISTYPSNSDWTFVDATVALGEFAGKTNVKIAFVYKSEKKSGTWEIKKATLY